MKVGALIIVVTSHHQGGFDVSSIEKNIVIKGTILHDTLQSTDYLSYMPWNNELQKLQHARHTRMLFMQRNGQLLLLRREGVYRQIRINASFA